MGNSKSKRGSTDQTKYITAETKTLASNRSDPVMITDDTFIIIDNHAIHTFDIKKNKWMKPKLIPSPHEKHKASFNHIRFDKERNVLSVVLSYLHCILQWMELDLKTFEWRIKTPLLHFTMTEPPTIIINDELHCMRYPGQHQVWNKKTQSLEDEARFTGGWLDSGCKLIYLQQKKRLFLFDGREKQQWNIGAGTNGCMFEYNFHEKQWNDLNIDKPNGFSSSKAFGDNLSKFNMLSCKNEDYILIFDAFKLGDIYIYDIKGNVLVKSGVTLEYFPVVSKPIIMNEYNQLFKQLLLNGYVHNMEDMNIPQDIMDLISIMMGNEEYLYIVSGDLKQSQKIPVYQILAQS